jgi:hypothetical protein
MLPSYSFGSRRGLAIEGYSAVPIRCLKFPACRRRRAANWDTGGAPRDKPVASVEGDYERQHPRHEGERGQGDGEPQRAKRQEQHRRGRKDDRDGGVGAAAVPGQAVAGQQIADGRREDFNAGIERRGEPVACARRRRPHHHDLPAHASATDLAPNLMTSFASMGSVFSAADASVSVNEATIVPPDANTRRRRNEIIASRLLDSGIVGIEQGDRADHGSGRAQGVGEFLVGVCGSRDIGDMAEEIPCPLLDKAGCLARLPGTGRLGKAVRDDGGGRFARQASAFPASPRWPSSEAKLLRVSATLGWFAPRACSRIASARL